MFEKEAEEYCNKIHCTNCGFNDFIPCQARCHDWQNEYDIWKDGAELGYNKVNEWYKVSDKLPELDVLVYLWDSVDDFPVVGRRHIPCGEEKWVWDCKWGSGYTVSQSAGKDYWWKEIILPQEV